MRPLPVMNAAAHETDMYRPDHFRVEDIAEMHALMRARPEIAAFWMSSWSSLDRSA